ncbi:MAG: HEAT repeat domain-containing protein [Armatimonadota bacterium]
MLTRCCTSYAAIGPLLALCLLLLTSSVPGRTEDAPIPEATQQLIQQLNSENPVQRAQAADALGRSGDARVVTDLLPLLNDEFVLVHGAVVTALGRLGNPQAVDALILALKDKESGVRTQAATALGLLRDPKATDALFAVLQEPDLPADLRQAITASVGKVRDKRVLPILLTALRDPAPATRAAAIASIGALHDPAMFKTLFPLLMDTDAGVRAAVATAMGKMTHPNASTALIALLETETEDPVRLAAVRGLIRQRAPEAVFLLFNIKHEESSGRSRNQELISAAQMALQQTGEATIDEVLKVFQTVPAPGGDNMALRNEQTRRRSTAMNIMWGGTFQSPRLRAAFLDVIGTDESNSYNLMNLLSMPRHWRFTHSVDGIYDDLYEPIASAYPKLEREVWCSDSRVTAHHYRRFMSQKGNGAWDAVDALRRKPSPAMINDLAPLLKDPAAYTRLAAAGVLVKIGDQRGMDTLAELLGNTEEWVCSRVVWYLNGGVPEQIDPAPLAKALNDAKPKVRSRAADALAATRDDRAVPALIERLQKDDAPEVREHIALALGIIGDPQAVDALIAASKDTVEWSRSAAVWALGQIGDPRAFDTLVALVAGGEQRTQVRAARALAQLGDARGFDALVTLCKSGDSMTRYMALNTLARLKMKEPRVVDHLLTLLGQTKDSSEKSTILQVLAVCADARAVNVLSEIAQAEENYPWSGPIAARALGATGDRRVADTLADLVHDGLNDAVRTEAAVALMKLGDPRGLTTVLEIARNPFSTGRNTAVAELVGVDDPRVAPLCADLLRDDDPLTRIFAARVLVQQQDPRGVEALIVIIEKEDELVSRLAALRFLGEAKSLKAIPSLVTALKTGKIEERTAILDTLGAIGDKSAFDPLCAAFHDPNPRARQHAAIGLAALGDARAVAALNTQLQQEQSLRVRLAIENALTKLVKK